MLKRDLERAPQCASMSAPVLTSRQAKVLQLIAEGYSNQSMADLLSLSKKTVEKHRQALMDKLDIHETATLTRYAVVSGAVETLSYAQLAGRPRNSARALRLIPFRDP
jgi:DNA-binding NarL/FixJ family response regulator